MFKKILVALDRSDMSQLVFAAALDLAKNMGADLTILHVLSPETEESPNVQVMLGHGTMPGFNQTVLDIYQNLWKTYEERGLEMLQSYVERATASNVTVESLQALGSPSRVISEIARQLQVDLIVVGRRGYSGLNELILGSVSSAVMHRAPCSVLVIQSPQE